MIKIKLPSKKNLSSVKNYFKKHKILNFLKNDSKTFAPDLMDLYFIHQLIILNKSGPFWTDKNDYNAITKLINKVYNYDEKSWLNINKKFKDRIMSYDENNKTFSLVLKKIIN